MALKILTFLTYCAFSRNKYFEKEAQMKAIIMNKIDMTSNT